MSLFGQSSHGLAMFPHALRWLLTYEAAAKSKATQQNIVESTPSAIQASSEKRCAETARQRPEQEGPAQTPLLAACRSQTTCGGGSWRVAQSQNARYPLSIVGKNSCVSKATQGCASGPPGLGLPGCEQLGVDGNAFAHLAHRLQPRRRAPRDGRCEGFSGEGTRTRRTCMPPITSRESNLFLQLHTESTSTTVLAAWCLLDAAKVQKRRPPTHVDVGMVLGTYTEMSTKSSKLMLMLVGSTMYVPPSKTTKSPVSLLFGHCGAQPLQEFEPRTHQIHALYWHLLQTTLAGKASLSQ